MGFTTKSVFATESFVQISVNPSHSFFQFGTRRGGTIPSVSPRGGMNRLVTLLSTQRHAIRHLNWPGRRVFNACSWDAVLGARCRCQCCSSGVSGEELKRVSSGEVSDTMECSPVVSCEVPKSVSSGCAGEISW